MLALPLRQVTHCTTVAKGRQRRVGMQLLRNGTVAMDRLPCIPAARFHSGAAMRQVFGGDAQVDGVGRDVDVGPLTIFETPYSRPRITLYSLPMCPHALYRLRARFLNPQPHHFGYRRFR